MRTRTPTSPKTAVRRLAIGRLISVTGGAAAYTALNFTVWDRTHSPGMQALSLLLTFGVAGILGPFAGALGDRFDRRRVMIASEAVASAFFIAMVFVEDPGLLIAIAFGSAIAELPFFSASRAAIPNLVEHEEDISWANSLITVGVHAGIAVGPLLGGLIVAGAGARWVFGINAVSFVISLVLTITVHGRFADPVREVSQDEDRGITAGIRFLFGEAVLRRMSLAWVVFVLGMGMGMVADAPMAESFGTGATGFGFLIVFPSELFRLTTFLSPDTVLPLTTLSSEPVRYTARSLPETVLPVTAFPLEASRFSTRFSPSTRFPLSSLPLDSST